MAYINLQSKNYPTHCVRHQDFRLKMTEIRSDLDREDASFIFRDGLIGMGGGMAGVISLESKNFPGHFIRHSDFHGFVARNDGSELFKADASWRIVGGLADPRGFSFESINFPGHFLRHSSFLLEVQKFEDTKLFREDATFFLQPAATAVAGGHAALSGGVSLRSSNFSSRLLRHDGFRLKITEPGGPADDFIFDMVEPLDRSKGGMREGWVSLRSRNFPDRFARHKSFEGWIDPNDRSALFAADATFCVRAGLAGKGVSFESLNYPGHFLRHSGFVIFLHKFEESKLYREDATFSLEDATTRGAVPAHIYGGAEFVQLRSSNFPTHFLRHSSFRARIDPLSSPLDFADGSWDVEDGLAREFGGLPAGCVSFKSKNFPDRFLRHRSFELWLDPQDGSDLARKDASFFVRPALNGNPAYFSLEAVNFPGHFLRHSGFVLFLHKFEDSKLYREDASFAFAVPGSGEPLPTSRIVGSGFGFMPSYYGAGGGAGGAWAGAGARY